MTSLRVIRDAGEGLRVIRDAGEGVIGCQEARKARGQAGLEVRKVRSSEDRLFTVKSLSSYPPTLLSSDNPLPSPPPREGACSCKSDLQAYSCHCERQNGASQSHNIYINNEITTSNASHSPRNDIENSCKTQVADAAATLPIVAPLSNSLPKGARGIDFASLIPSLEGSANERRAKRRRAGDGVAVPLFANEQDREGVGESQPSPQPSPTGEEVSNYKMLKQVQHDTNSSKRTYLFTYSLIHLVNAARLH